MALFGFGKDKQKDAADPNVMAYLEDAMRVKSPSMIIDGRKNEVPCLIASIQESAGTMQLQLQANLIAEKGAKIGFILIIDNMRIGGNSKIQEVKPGSAVIDIPDSFELMERRKKQRAKINPREGTTCTLLTGMFDGIGVMGLADNLSEVGVRIKVENAIEIKSEKKINITGRTLQPGQIFPIFKLTKIPRVVATLECGGKLVYTEVTSGSAYLGVTFEEMKSEFARTIDNFVSSRSSPAPTSLPPRARRMKEERVDAGPRPASASKEKESSGTAKDAKEDTKKNSKSGSTETETLVPTPDTKTDSASAPDHVPAPSTAAMDAPPQSGTAPMAPEDKAVIQEPVADVIEAPPENAVKGASEITLNRPIPTPLQKLKRKARTIVLFGTEEEVLLKLGQTLLTEGYGKVIHPHSLEDLIDSAPPAGTGIILLDLDMPFENCLAISGSILAHLPEKTQLVLVSEYSEEGVVRSTLDAQNAGISLLLPRPLKINDALFDKLEEIMGI